MKVAGIAFDEEVISLNAQDFKARVTKISGTGKVPALVDGEVAVWESLAIMEYLADRHGGVLPTDADARAWARCAAAEMHSGFQALRNICSMSCGVRVKLGSQPEALVKDIARLGELWTEGLRRHGGPFLAGKEFGGVDAFFCPVAFRVQSYGLELPPEAAAYARRLLAMASMKRWYEAALAEPHRDPDHDAEIAQAGKVVQDLRVSARATATT